MAPRLATGDPINVTFIIRALGIVVYRGDLEPGEYTIGRSSDCDIVLHQPTVSRKHARLSHDGTNWHYRDLREPNLPAVVVDARPIQIAKGIELFTGNNIELEKTAEHVLPRLRRRAGARRLAVAALVIAVAAVGGPFIYERLRTKPMDANALLEFARPKIVEFELPSNEKARRDFKHYAKLADEDFSGTAGYCTGFIIDKDVVATANHCLHGYMFVDGRWNFRLKTHDGAFHVVDRLLGFDAKRDVAYLEVKTLGAYGHLKMKDSAEVGHKVFTVGNVEGQGIAIREGILASTTKDPNDPNIEFIRYSAAASPGNSGGPLIDEYGNVIALVFARSWGENYNVGTSAKYLREDHKKYAGDRSDKTLTADLSDLSHADPGNFLLTIGIPTPTSWYENPEYRRTFENIRADVTLPRPLDEHAKAIVQGLEASAREKYETALKDMAANGHGEVRWETQVSDRVPIILPSQLDNYYSALKDEKGLVSSPEIGLQSPAPAMSYKSFVQRLGTDQQYYYTANAVVAYMEAQTKENKDWLASFVEEDERFYQSHGWGKRSISYVQNFVFAHIAAKPGDGGDWEGMRQMTGDNVLKALTGKDGMLASSRSHYVRPRSHRDFTIRQLDEDLEEAVVNDEHGRTWTRRSFQLFGTSTADIYCLPVPQGVVCIADIHNVMHEPLLSVVRSNRLRYSMSAMALRPTFWNREALVDFFAKGHAAKYPTFRDFTLHTKNGKLRAELGTVGLDVQLDPKAKLLRLDSGIVMTSDGPHWAAVGVHEYRPSRKICAVAIELDGVKTSSMLESHRSNLKSGYRKLVWTQAVNAPKIETKASAFGFCAATDKDATGGAIRVRTYQAKPWRPVFKNGRS